MLQLVPGAIEKQEVNVGNEKSSPFVPVKVPTGKLRDKVESPVFDTVTKSEGLCVFTAWLGKVRGDGERLMTGPVADPFSVRVSGPPAESV